MTGNDRDRPEQPRDQPPDRRRDPDRPPSERRGDRGGDPPPDRRRDPDRPPEGREEPPPEDRSAPESSPSEGPPEREPAPPSDRRPDPEQKPPEQAVKADPAQKEVITTHPTIRPIMLRLALVIVLGVVTVGVLFTNPQLLGSRDTTDIALLLVQVLVVIAVIRLLIKMLILRRTTYTVTSTSVKREYELLMRHETREIPFQLVRSHEFDQSRIETLLGHGTIALNQGLGQLKMENIQDPREVYDVITDRIAEHR